MIDSPRISIVTPSFNQSPFLEATLRSVLDQDYPNLEYIVMDGGSTDGSVEIIRRHASRLAFWLSEKDRGQAEAILKGFAHATGDVFAWLNSDDVLAPSAVRMAAEHFKLDSSIGLVYGDRLHIDAKGNVIGVNQGPSYYPSMLRRFITIPQETAFFRKTAFEHAGGLDPNLHFALDFDLWCRLDRVTRFKHLPAFMAAYREHASSKSVVMSHEAGETASKYMDEQRTVYRKHFAKSFPRPISMKIYRLLHQFRFALERMQESYREERAELRRLSSDGAPARELMASKNL